ncbi:MFS transporter [Paraburkholderia kirstenboschensis]
MENLDATVIATALPHMAATFGVTSVSLNIGMTAYLLALAVFIPISGWVADRFGQRALGGFISTYFNWRWIFLLNVPIGLLGLGLTALFIPNYREPTGRPFDVSGFALSGIALPF